MENAQNIKYSEFEWFGCIPNHWQMLPMKLLLEKIYSGGTPTTSVSEFWTDDENGINWVAISDISKSNGLLTETSKRITPKGLNSKNLEIIPKGTLLLSIFASLGKTTTLGIDSTVNQAIIGLKPNEKLNQKFLQYLFEDCERYISYYSSANTQENLNVTKIKDLAFPVPPINEQLNIAQFLDQKTEQIDTIIEKKQNLLLLLEEKKKAVINEAVTKGLNSNVPMKDSGLEWIGEIPEDWKINKLKYHFNFNGGLNITKADLKDEGIPCISYGEIHSKYGFDVNTDRDELKFVEEDYIETHPNALLHYGDFIFADTSEDIEGSGNFTYFNDTKKAFAGYHTIIGKSQTVIVYRYFAYLFDSISFRSQIQSSVKGVKVFSITKTILNDISLIIPSLTEQSEIVEYLDARISTFKELKEKIFKQIEKLKEYRQSIISEAVTGKIDVSNYN